MEAVNQRKEGELRSALEEAQAEASQAKKQVHTLKTQVRICIWKYSVYQYSYLKVYTIKFSFSF